MSGLSTVGQQVKAKLERGDGGWMTPQAAYDYYSEHDPNPVSVLVLAWHIQNDVDEFDTKMVPNPEGDSPSEIPVVSKVSIDRFIEKRRKAQPEEPDETGNDELPIPEAYAYYRSLATNAVAQSLFSQYTSYGVLPCSRQSNRITIKRKAIDAFLDSYPDGRLKQETRREELEDDDMRIENAYAYYSEIDPSPVKIATFRTMLSNGIIGSVRRLDGRRILGVRKVDVDRFVEARKSLVEKSPKASGRTDKGNGKSKTLTVGEAYDLYRSLVHEPLSITWFRNRIREGDIQAVKTDDPTPGIESWLVDADSLRVYLETVKTPTPRKRLMGLAEAYKYYRRLGIIPEKTTESAFKKLVKSGEIESERSSDAPRARFYVHRQGVEAYFSAKPKPEPEAKDTPPVPVNDDDLSMTIEQAFEYYGTLDGAKAIPLGEFWRIVDHGEIVSKKASRARNAPRLISRSAVQEFVARPPEDEPEENPPPTTLPEWMTPEEVAVMVRVDPEDVLEAWKAGELPGKKIGKKVRFAKAAVRKWLDG